MEAQGIYVPGVRKEIWIENKTLGAIGVEMKLKAKFYLNMMIFTEN